MPTEELARRASATPFLLTGAALIERVCVVGAAIGSSLYAAHLARVTESTSFAGERARTRFERARPARVGAARVRGRVRAATDPAELRAADLAIVATKATELETAAAALRGHWPGAAVMTVQNGLGAEEIVRRHGDWPLISAVTFMSGTRHEDTLVEYILDTETWLGPFSGRRRKPSTGSRT